MDVLSPISYRDEFMRMPEKNISQVSKFPQQERLTSRFFVADIGVKGEVS